MKKNMFRLIAIMLTVILMIFPAFVTSYLILGSELTGEPHNAEDIGSFGNIKKAEHTWHSTHNYVSNDYEDSVFFKYLAKKQ